MRALPGVFSCTLSSEEHTAGQIPRAELSWLQSTWQQQQQQQFLLPFFWLCVT